MAIIVKTHCEDCIHKSVCSYTNNAENDANKLKKMTYGCGPNDDYYWDVMSDHRKVNITFECVNFNAGVKIRRPLEFSK